MDEFEELKKKISKDKNFSCAQYKDPYLKRRFAIRMRATATKSYRTYMELLDTNPEEYPILLNVLTVNVTEFFRDTSVFEEVKRVLGLAITAKQETHRSSMRIWSAGCSNGSEAYTIAMLSDHILGTETNSFKVSIYATDIDDSSLKRGRDGIYKPDLLKGVAKPYLQKYFNEVDGDYQVTNATKNMVRFKRNDLINERPLPMMDMIFCRNVVIYFSRELQEKLFMNFYRSLNDGGYFVMGKTETLVGEARDKFIPVNNKERIYQKLVK
ncbi:MAG: protein-glutamate O-methyltransferase CheR [Euryarchaeota archaeon]|nr:MAG: Chemotaxis protein methyltransferase [ANME-2 cluster archaeon]MEA1864111.1 protein-glutamate O-methyltransferase CheR [Euryarchaeota archaeon]